MLWLTLSLLAAVAFGLRGMLYHWTSQKPVNRNLMLSGVFGMGAIVNLAGSLLLSADWTIHCLVGIQMGLFSFAASASMFKGFAVGKASIVAILTALPSVVVVLAAFWFWDERISGVQLLAFAVIIGGVLLVRYSNELSLRNLQGAQWGLLAMFMFAGNDLSSKWSTLLGADLMPTLFFMFATGTACFGLWWLADRRRESATRASISAMESAAARQWSAGESGVRRDEESAVRSAGGNGVRRDEESAVRSAGERGARSAALSSGDPLPSTDVLLSEAVRQERVSSRPRARAGWSVRRTFATGLAIGLTNTAGMLLIVPAFDLGKTGLVSAVIALNVPLVLLYTRFVVKEKFSKAETAGILMSLAGILLMRLFGV